MAGLCSHSPKRRACEAGCRQGLEGFAVPGRERAEIDCGGPRQSQSSAQRRSIGEGVMEERNGLSRRHALGFLAATGGLAMSGGAVSQTSKRIEQLAPELDKIISTSEPIQDLADGFGGALGPAEGPLWWKENGYLLFSDIHNNKRMKYEPGKGVSLFLEPTNRANGLTRDLQGRLLACEHDTRRVTRLELDGGLTVIANSFQGRQLNRPNDDVAKSDGCIYFTDPWTNPNAPN